MVKKMPKKGQKNKKKISFKKKSKCGTCFYIHFSRPLKNLVFRSVTLLTKKLWAIF